MSNWQYTSDILEDVLFRAGEKTDGTSDFATAALRYINRAYQAVCKGGDELAPDISEVWWWLKKSTPGVLILEPKKDTGTIAVTNNSASATLSASVASDLDGWFLRVDGHPDVFRVSSHTGGSAALTLDSVYTGDTDTEATYELFKLEYTLASDVLYLPTAMRTYSDEVSRIDGIGEEMLDQMYPLWNAQAGVPRAFAMIGEQEVRFSHYGGTESGDLIRVEYPYIRTPDDLTNSDQEEPLLPRPYRKILADGALFFLHMDKNDDRADGVGLMAQAGLRAMQMDHRKRLLHQSTLVGHIAPRYERFSRFRRGLLRTQSGLVIR